MENRILMIALGGGLLWTAAAVAQDDDRVTRAEKAEAICTGAAEPDAFPRWEIDPDYGYCPAASANGVCAIRLKKDHSVIEEFSCPVSTGGDDNEAAAPVTVYEGSRPPQQE